MNNFQLTLNTKLPFGKYKGLQVFQLIEKDLEYLDWLINKWDGGVCPKIKYTINSNSIKNKQSKYKKDLKDITQKGLQIKILKACLFYDKNQTISFKEIFSKFTLESIKILLEHNYIKII